MTRAKRSEETAPTPRLKRLVIFFFYDGEGVADKYVFYFLKELRKNSDELCVVCNGELTDDSRRAFDAASADVSSRLSSGSVAARTRSAFASRLR